MPKHPALRRVFWAGLALAGGLAIAGGIAFPIPDRDVEQGCVSGVQTQLQTIRSQIERYRMRNNGALPDFATNANAGWGDPDADTDAARGLLSDEYLRSVPVNPCTGTSHVVIGVRADALVVAEQGDPGWVWDEATGEIFAMGYDDVAHEWIQAPGSASRTDRP